MCPFFIGVLLGSHPPWAEARDLNLQHLPFAFLPSIRGAITESCHVWLPNNPGASPFRPRPSSSRTLWASWYHIWAARSNPAFPAPLTPAHCHCALRSSWSDKMDSWSCPFCWKLQSSSLYCSFRWGRLGPTHLPGPSSLWFGFSGLLSIP